MVRFISGKVPVEVGDEFNVFISALGERGDGIARHDNFVIIVKGAETGKNYKIGITKVFDKYAFAEIIE